MFSHVMVGSNDIDRSKRFYDALFEQGPAHEDDKGRLAYRKNGAVFMVTSPIDGAPASHAQRRDHRLQLRHPRGSRRVARRRRARPAAPRVEDPPGYRENAFGKLYLAYMRDPDGNKLCGLHRPQQ